MNRRYWKKIRKILESGWSKETTYQGCKHDYGKKGFSKSYGQCYVTARAIHKVFGGKIIRNKEENHYWNRLPDGTELDFTSNQLGGDGINPVKNLKWEIKEKLKPPSNRV